MEQTSVISYFSFTLLTTHFVALFLSFFRLYDKFLSSNHQPNRGDTVSYDIENHLARWEIIDMHAVICPLRNLFLLLLIM